MAPSAMTTPAARLEQARQDVLAVLVDVDLDALSEALIATVLVGLLDAIDSVRRHEARHARP